MRKHRIDWWDVIKILMVVMTLAVILAMTVSSVLAVIAYYQTEKQINIAMVRYFDGSTDTLQISRYATKDGTVMVWTRDGQVCISSANNIILLSDDDYPRD